MASLRLLRTQLSHPPTHVTLIAARHISTELHRHSSNPSFDIPPPSSQSSSQSQSSKSNSSIQDYNWAPRPSPPPFAPHLSDPPINPNHSVGLNQTITSRVPQEIQSELDGILKEFRAPIRYAFAYGSGVFKQSGYGEKEKPMLDFIFAVSHPSHWHAINMHQNPSHYATLPRWMGSGFVRRVQEGIGARVWFNTGVEVNGRNIKYGVVSVESLCADLLDWETLYLSGRMQKPISVLRDDPRVRLANQVNLSSSLRAALLLLPSQFTEHDLYTTIAGLSYRGDFRMRYGENPHKVRNIVSAQYEAFQDLYGGLLHSFRRQVHVKPGEGEGGRKIEQSRETRDLVNLLTKLPKGLKEKVWGQYEGRWNLASAKVGPYAIADGEFVGKSEGEKSRDEKEGWERIAGDKELQETIDRSIQTIIYRPTYTQSCKGIISAGPTTSINYVVQKLLKKSRGSTK